MIDLLSENGNDNNNSSYGNSGSILYNLRAVYEFQLNLLFLICF